MNGKGASQLIKRRGRAMAENYNADADERRKEGYVTMDSTLADIIAKRETPIPSLEYLKYGDATSYGHTFSYSEEMLAAVGANERKRTKGTLGKTSYSDGGAPWAFLPKELEEPIVSLYGQDFVKRSHLNPLEGRPPMSAKDTLKRRKAELARQRDELRDQQAAARSHARELERQKQYVPRERVAVVKIFSHNGVDRRCVSAPPDVPDTALSAISHSAKTVPLLLDTPAPDNPLAGGECGLAKVKADATKNPRSLYPAERQRAKFAMLEAQRHEQGQSALVRNGWASATELGGKAKRCGRPELDHHLSAEDRAAVEEEFRRIKERESYRREAKAAQEREMQEVTAGAAVESECTGHGEDDAGAPATAAPMPCKPIVASFRPELPGAVARALPSNKCTAPLAQMESPPVVFSSPPPWGRQTALDDKWQKVRVYKSRTKEKVYEPVQKIEIDRELRTVRDQGLLKKERRSLLKSMDPRQIEYIKSLPSDFGKSRTASPVLKPVKSVKPMKPAASIAAAYLK